MKSNTRQFAREQGFSLIELMIAVAITGILASIAYPSYKEQIARGRRSQAESILLTAQLWMERFYTENYSYSDNSAGTAVTDSTQFPSRFTTSPPPGEGSPVYDITVTAPTAASFTITAARKVGTVMADDKCGNLTIDHLGRKSIEGSTWSSAKFSSKAIAIESCWK